jgi:hypothetical protein
VDAPLPGDRGAHGIFNQRARTRSTKLWARTHRGWLALAGGLITAFTAALVGGPVRRALAPKRRLAGLRG